MKEDRGKGEEEIRGGQKNKGKKRRIKVGRVIEKLGSGRD